MRRALADGCYVAGCGLKRSSHGGPRGLRLVQDDGWFLVRPRGSQRQCHSRAKPGAMPIAGLMPHPECACEALRGK